MISLITSTIFLAQVQAWGPVGLNKDLYPIAMLESSFGNNINHSPNSMGPMWTSFGGLGLKPVVAHEDYRQVARFSTAYPGLEDEGDFYLRFTNDDIFYNYACNIHWNRLIAQAPYLEYAIYSWRWGQTAARQASPTKVLADHYVIRYKELLTEMRKHK